jgi:hypothetical protein
MLEREDSVSGRLADAAVAAKDVLLTIDVDVEEQRL